MAATVGYQPTSILSVSPNLTRCCTAARAPPVILFASNLSDGRVRAAVQLRMRVGQSQTKPGAYAARSGWCYTFCCLALTRALLILRASTSATSVAAWQLAKLVHLIRYHSILRARRLLRCDARKIAHGDLSKRKRDLVTKANKQVYPWASLAQN